MMKGDIFIEDENGLMVKTDISLPKEDTKTKVYNKIRLYPTSFDLHTFFYYQSKEELKEEFDKVFPKEGWEGYFQSLRDGDIAFVENLETESVGKTTIMVLKKPTLQTLVHEIVHVLNHLNSYTNIEIGPQAQEWNAYFQDYLFKELALYIRDVVES